MTGHRLGLQKRKKSLFNLLSQIQLILLLLIFVTHDVRACTAFHAHTTHPSCSFLSNFTDSEDHMTPTLSYTHQVVHCMCTMLITCVSENMINFPTDRFKVTWVFLKRTVGEQKDNYLIRKANIYQQIGFLEEQRSLIDVIQG